MLTATGTVCAPTCLSPKLERAQNRWDLRAVTRKLSHACPSRACRAPRSPVSTRQVVPEGRRRNRGPAPIPTKARERQQSSADLVREGQAADLPGTCESFSQRRVRACIADKRLSILGLYLHRLSRSAPLQDGGRPQLCLRVRAPRSGFEEFMCEVRLCAATRRPRPDSRRSSL